MKSQPEKARAFFALHQIGTFTFADETPSGGQILKMFEAGR
ncbi:MAG: hypothetical protein ACPGVY_11195 [Mycobacterium sp.]